MKKNKNKNKNQQPDVNILIPTARGPSVLRFYDAGSFLWDQSWDVALNLG